MKTEFLALAVAGEEAEWLRNLLDDIELRPQPMQCIYLYFDSEATLYIAYSKVCNQMYLQISLRNENLKQLITYGTINVVSVRTNKNLSLK